MQFWHKCSWAFQDFEGPVLISEYIEEDYLNSHQKIQPLLHPSYSLEILIDFTAVF